MKTYGDEFLEHTELIEDIVKYRGLDEEFKRECESIPEDDENRKLIFAQKHGLMRFSFCYIDCPSRYVQYSDDIIAILLDNFRESVGKRYIGFPYKVNVYSDIDTIVNYLKRFIEVINGNHTKKNVKDIRETAEKEVSLLELMKNNQYDELLDQMKKGECEGVEYDDVFRYFFWNSIENDKDREDMHERILEENIAFPRMVYDTLLFYYKKVQKKEVKKRPRNTEGHTVSAQSLAQQVPSQIKKEAASRRIAGCIKGMVDRIRPKGGR